MYTKNDEESAYSKAEEKRKNRIISFVKSSLKPYDYAYFLQYIREGLVYLYDFWNGGIGVLSANNKAKGKEILSFITRITAFLDDCDCGAENNADIETLFTDLGKALPNWWD